MSSPTSCYIHVYYHNIQRASSLKLLGLLKPNFTGNIYTKGETNVFIDNPCHMTKMTAMPIYGKHPTKHVFSRTTKPVSTKHDM